jgi:hypothetical protein
MSYHPSEELVTGIEIRRGRTDWCRSVIMFRLCSDLLPDNPTWGNATFRVVWVQVIPLTSHRLDAPVTLALFEVGSIMAKR